MVAEKQLCFFIERGAKPRRTRTDEQILLVLLASFHNWRDSIVIVTPRTFQNWIRQYVLGHEEESTGSRGKHGVGSTIRDLVNAKGR
jgi:hypothetical protein